MKLLSVPLARTIWVLNMEEINPRGRNIFADLVPTLVKRYKFKSAPKEDGDFSKDGMRFTAGTFTNTNADSLMAGLTVWSDGLAGDTFSSTDDSEEFLSDIVQILPELGYEFESKLVRRKTFNSQLHVECRNILAALNPRLSEFLSGLSTTIGQPFEFAGFDAWPDQTKPDKPVAFSFQRRAGDPMDGDRYWSQAPLPTGKHLHVLKELEALLS